MGKIRKILETELVGGTQSTDVYPVTSTKAVYDTNNKVLDDYIQHLKKTSTFACIATPTTNPGTPDGPVFYIAGEGTYANFSNIVIEAGQLGILKWNGTWSKEVLEIGAGGGGGVVDTAAIKKIVNDTIKNISWWGQKINNNKVDGSIVITKGSHSFTIELDDNGNLKFNGNIYATGGITALGVGTTTGGGSSASLGTLLAQLNNENPFPTANGQVLTYDGSNFIWKTPTGSGGTSGGGIRIKRNGNTLKDSNGNVLSCTSINFKYGENWNSTPILINSDNEISVDLSVVANNGNGSSSSSNYPLTIYNGSSNTDYITYDGSSSAYLKFKSGFSISKVGLGYEISVSGGGSGVTLNPTMSAMNEQLDKTSYGTPQFLYWNGSRYTWKNESEISGGSGSSGTTAGKLYFYKDGSEEYWNGESNFKIVFGSGLNVTWDSHSQITLSATGGSGGSGGSTSTSVSWNDVTGKPSTFAPSSHTHSASDITGKVNNATNADKATQLANSRTIWGQSFNGTGDINGHLYMGTEGGGSIQLYMNNGNMLDRTNNTLHIGNGLKQSSNGEISLDAYVTKVYTDNMSKHYDFKSNVFDVNSNQIHFGSETNGGKISWDAANNAFKIEGNVYATGGITALGVSNNATTSNNVDFTFRSVTANTFNVKNSIQLSDSLSLTKFGKDVYLGSTDVSLSNYIYLDGMDRNYYLSSQGDAYFNSLHCDILNFSGCTNFKIVDANDTGFAIQFTYNGKTYKFIPSESNLIIS